MPRLKWKKDRKPSPSSDADMDTEKTTVILFRLPKHMTAEHLFSLLDNDYFAGYNYFYFPMDERTWTNTGSACINFRSHCTAKACKNRFQGFQAWPTGNSLRKCKTAWSDVQGYEANIQIQQKYIDYWQHSNVPDDCKPMVLDKKLCRYVPFYVATVSSELCGSSAGQHSSTTSSGCKEESIAPKVEKVEGVIVGDHVLAKHRFACLCCSKSWPKWGPCWKHMLEETVCWLYIYRERTKDCVTFDASYLQKKCEEQMERVLTVQFQWTGHKAVKSQEKKARCVSLLHVALVLTPWSYNCNPNWPVNVNVTGGRTKCSQSCPLRRQANFCSSDGEVTRRLEVTRSCWIQNHIPAYPSEISKELTDSLC